MDTYTAPYLLHMEAAMTTQLTPLEFVVTPSDHGAVVRVAVDELARATGLDVRPKYGHPIVGRDEAVALLAFAGATPDELRTVGAAFDATMAQAAIVPAARVVAPPMAQPAPVAPPAPPVEARIAPVVHMRPAAPPAPVVAQPAPAATTFEAFQATEKEAILAALNATEWNKVRAAKIVGLPRRTFYRRLAEYGIGDTATTQPAPAPVVEATPKRKYTRRVRTA